ncbi:hypothetical protein Hte_000363 [Hypoxylon texense]
MGLAGPKNRRKIQHDPNNTKWSRDETNFGHKILRAQGWEPGKFLGVQNSSHSHLHTVASSAPIKVTLKDDTLGLGAQVRQKQSTECTGLDGFKDLLGRLNGKSEETIKQEQEIRSSNKTSLFAEQRYGPMRFVRGGLLVGDQMQDLISTDIKKLISEKKEDEKSSVNLEDIPVYSEKKQKKDKTSKKRKVEEPDSVNGTDSVQEQKRKKRSKDESSRDDLADGQEARESGKKSKKSKREDDEGIEQVGSERKKKRKEKKSRSDPERSAEDDVTEETAVESSESKKEKKERRKREKREKKQKRLETADSSAEIAASTDISTSILAATPQDSGVSTPTGTGTSTPQAFSARHYARSRNIASKRMAMADLQALNQIFMTIEGLIEVHPVKGVKWLRNHRVQCVDPAHFRAKGHSPGGGLERTRYESFPIMQGTYHPSIEALFKSLVSLRPLTRNAWAPGFIPAAPPGGDRSGWQHAPGQPMPLHSAPYPRHEVPPKPVIYTVTPSGPRRRRRSTADSYVSDYGQSEASARHGRVRFSEPDRSSRRSNPSDSEDVDEEDDDDDDDDSSDARISYPSRSRSRSRLSHHHAYRSSYANDSDEDDEEGFDETLGGKVFQFVPSRASRSLSKSGHSIDTDVSLEKSEDGTTIARDGLNGPKTNNILHIFQSKYTGDAVSDGTHTAKLTVVHDPKKQRQPLFRWMHLEQRMMNLDELSAEISRIPAITDSERNGFAKLLTEVKRSAVKVRPTSNGNNVRHMDPKPVRVTIPPDGRTKGQTSRSLTWLCVPYFSLEKYSGLLSASTASSFPIETLLQSEYARTTKERDMQQAVCQNGEAPEGVCFHIAQLWCIVLDNSLLVTCGGMSSTALRGDHVRIVNEPLKEPSAKGKMIYVAYYDSVLWQLPLESCLTWFDFFKHFREFWPQAVKVFHHGHAISETDWPRIVNMVKNVNTKVTLDLRLWYHQHPPPIGVLRTLAEEVEGTTQAVPETTKAESQNPKAKLSNKLDKYFHVFSWLIVAENEANDTESDGETLVAQLREVEDYLLNSTTTRDRNTYHNCNSSSQRSVHAYLKDKGLEIEKTEEEPEEKGEYENRIDLYNAADIVFSFFLPQLVNADAPTVEQFWGSIRSLVDDIMSHTPAHLRSKIEVADGLVRAWLHLVMALVQASVGDEAWNENMSVADALIRRGMNDIRTYSSINNTYSDYLKGLENEITANNSDRSHQFRIALFKQEIAVIRRVVASQVKVVDGMTVPQRSTWSDQTRREREMLEREREKSKADTVRMRSHEKQGTAYVDRIDVYEASNPYYKRSLHHFVPDRDPDAFSKLASTDPGGFPELLGRECRSWLERRDNEFLELEVEASRLEDMNANKIEVTKDRQEAAVYAFTMVTIIFLPLSTISSIFGMNSSDVRDMELGQWAYWAAALPTTVAVIVTGLWWMGELHNMVDWLRGLPPARRNRGYARAKPPAANGVIYYPPGDYPGMEPPQAPPQAIRPYSRTTVPGPPVPPRASWRY